MIEELLENPKFFDIVQSLLGASKIRGFVVEKYMAPLRYSSVLDIGCGSGAILDFLPDNITYTGIDINKKYIDYARLKYPRGNFICCYVLNIGDYISNIEFGVVLAIGVLHHLSDEECLALFEFAHSVLTEYGALITVDSCFIPDQSRITRLLIGMDRGKYVRTPEKYKILAQRVFANVDGKVYHNRINVPYTHFFMNCTKL